MEKNKESFYPFNYNNLRHLLCLLIAITFIGCEGVTEAPQQSRKKLEDKFSGTGGGPIYEVNPVIASGRFDLSFPVFEDYVRTEFVTNNDTLATKCTFTQNVSDTFQITESTDSNCLSILNDRSADTVAINSLNGGWGYPVESDEFYQVNTYYHLNKIIERFYDSLSFAHKAVHFDSNLIIPPATKYNFVDTKSYWFMKDEQSQELVAFSKCFLDPINAFFSPADNILCFGSNDRIENFLIAQDPSVIYHEMGHAFVKIMMNQRNTTSGTDPNNLSPFFDSHPFQSDLGTLFYDEAGSINEGIADYFSYYMNQRSKIGEWGLGRFFNAARPLNEDDDLHTAPVSTNAGERLKYPDFLQYNIGDPEIYSEDVHYAGQIITHYLVALTNEFKTSCFADQSKNQKHLNSTDYVILLLNETLAEVGDLTAKGSDLFSEYATLDPSQEEVFFTNLNDEQSFLWTQVVNPPNFRRFFRIFGKNILHHISLNLCPDFTVTKSEQLLDEYGLLLFKSYEDKGQGHDFDNNNQMTYVNYNGSSVFSGKNLNALFSNNTVNEDNRKNSVLVAKDLLVLDPDVIGFVFDGQNDINGILANLTFEGKNITTTQGIAGTEYNNNNIKISPGEVVGLSLNLRNTSNSTMAGVQILANDWDHMKLNTPNDAVYTDGNPANDPPYNYVNSNTNISGLKDGDINGYIGNHSPCIFDDFPKETEGGVTDTTSTTEGSCSYTSRNNKQLDLTEILASTIYPKYDLDSPQPICLVQFNGENETMWVSQDHFRKTVIGLEDKDCLNNPSMSTENFNPNECLIRLLPGANTAVLGKIDAQKTWSETLIGDNENSRVSFSPANVVLMEVNKWIQPGTKFNCRFRVRFTNCDDCFSKSDGTEYTDKDYTGHAPFKLINFQFTVVD